MRYCVLALFLFLTAITATANDQLSPEDLAKGKILLKNLDAHNPSLSEIIKARDNGEPVRALELLKQHLRRRSNEVVSGYKFKASRTKMNMMFKDQYGYYGKTWTLERDAEGKRIWNSVHGFVHRHGEWASAGSLYLDSKDPEIPEKLMEIISSYIEDHYDVHDRGKTLSLLRLSWEGYTFFALLSSDAMDLPMFVRMLEYMYDQTWELQNAGYFHRYSNLAMSYCSGVISFSVQFPEFSSSAEWGKQAMRRLESLYIKDIYPDGVHTEQAYAYGLNLLGEMFDAVEKAETISYKISDDLQVRMREMSNFAAYSMRPDGTNPDYGDSPSTLVNRYFLTRVDYHEKHTPEALYIVTKGAKGKEPKAPYSAAFPWGGYLASRNNWTDDALYSFFDAGSYGTSGHAHRDKLSLFLSAYGRNLLVDGGKPKYNWSVWRTYYYQGSASHNVIMVEDKQQIANETISRTPPLRGKYKIDTTADFVTGRMDGFVGLPEDVYHERALVFLKEPGFWMVFDYVNSPDKRNYEALWHYSERCTVVAQENTAVSIDPEVGNLRIVPVSRDPFKLEIVKGREEPRIQGWKNFGQEIEKGVAAPCAVFSSESSSAAFAWVMMPGKGEVPEVEVEQLAGSDKRIYCRIKTASKSYDFAMNFNEDDYTPWQLPNGMTLQGRFAMILPGNKPWCESSRLLSEEDKILAESLPMPQLAGNDVFLERGTVKVKELPTGVQIRYTLDGSEVSLESPLYTTAGIPVSKDMLVRVRAFKADCQPSQENRFEIKVMRPIEPVAVAKRNKGVNYAYLGGSYFGAHMPDLHKIPGVEYGVAGGLDLSVLKAAHYCGVEFFGYFAAPETGMYTFTTESSATTTLHIGDKLVVDNQIEKLTPAKISGSIALKAGLHPIRVGYGRYWWPGPFNVSVKIPGRDEQPLTPDMLCHGSTDISDYKGNGK